MPVLTLDRDPLLISIDLQRLEDLGIPAVAGHECAATFYGPMGAIRPAIFVPDGWQDALPDSLPIEEEWDMEAWETALHDNSREHRKYSQPIGRLACFKAGISAGLLLSLTCGFIPFLVRAILSARSGTGHRFSYDKELAAFAMSFLLAGVVGGAVAPFAGRVIWKPNGIRTLIVLVLILGAISSNY